MLYRFCAFKKLLCRTAIPFLFTGTFLITFLISIQLYSINDFSISLKQDVATFRSFHPSTEGFVKRKHKFVYLIQTEKCLPRRFLNPECLGSSLSCSCEVFVLSYKSRCFNNVHSHVHYTFEQTSWSKGRNRLYELAKERNFVDVQYFIFLDDDIEIIFGDFAPKALQARAPARVFENFLLEHGPAIGVPDYNIHHGAAVMISKRQNLCGETTTNRKPLHIPTIHFDASFTAIHRNATDHLLPYPDKYDDTCWWHSQRYMIAAAEILFRGQVVMFTPVKAINSEHRDYPRDDSNAQKVWSHFVEELIERVPRAYREDRMLRDFQDNPTKYTENSLSICLNVPPKHPVQPFGHFTWNLTIPVL